MKELQLISMEKCKELSDVALGYATKHKKLAYCGACVVAFTVVANKLSFRKRFFAWLFNVSMANKFEEHEAVKKELLKPLAEQVSHDATLREENAIRILEIGVGAGSNFEHFPEGCHLVAVDPNPHFQKYYDQNRSKFSNIKSAEIILSKGEEMTMVQSGSIDAVVMTFVLCSVSNEDKFLRQVNRVLAPGGKFYFFEHVLEWDSRGHWLRRRLQQILTLSGFWPFVFDGCHLTKDPVPKIKAVRGFSDIQYEYFYAPVPDGIPKIVQPHCKGIATK